MTDGEHFGFNSGLGDSLPYTSSAGARGAVDALHAYLDRQHEEAPPTQFTRLFMDRAFFLVDGRLGFAMSYETIRDRGRGSLAKVEFRCEPTETELAEWAAKERARIASNTRRDRAMGRSIHDIDIRDYDPVPIPMIEVTKTWPANVRFERVTFGGKECWRMAGATSGHDVG